MTLTEALRAMMADARARGRYFAQRSGRLSIPGSKVMPDETDAARAIAHGYAQAFYAAADKIEALAKAEERLCYADETTQAKA